MATKIFVDQENLAATFLTKDHLNVTKLEKPLKGHTGKIFGSCGTVKTQRKAFGNVNKQIVNQKAGPVKSAPKAKKPAPVTKKISNACPRLKEQPFLEIEKIFPYNPEDFEILDVPEEHKLSHLCLTGLPLMVIENGFTELDETSALDVPDFTWESEVSVQYLLENLDEITIDLPPW